MSTVIDTLVTDRTWQDVAEGTAKGSYRAADLNRVGQAVLFLKDYLNGVQTDIDAYRESMGVAPGAAYRVPWSTINVTAKTDWVQTDVPTPAQMTNYLQAVRVVTAAATIQRALPLSMDYLDYVGANEIERCLRAEYAAAQKVAAQIRQRIENTAAAWVYSGRVNSGMIWSEFT